MWWSTRATIQGVMLVSDNGAETIMIPWRQILALIAARPKEAKDQTVQHTPQRDS